MSIKNYDFESQKEIQELQLQYNRLQVELLKLQVLIKQEELEKLHKM